jgi:hypothetical protein
MNLFMIRKNKQSYSSGAWVLLDVSTNKVDQNVYIIENSHVTVAETEFMNGQFR